MQCRYSDFILHKKELDTLLTFPFDVNAEKVNFLKASSKVYSFIYKKQINVYCIHMVGRVLLLAIFLFLFKC